MTYCDEWSGGGWRRRTIRKYPSTINTVLAPHTPHPYIPPIIPNHLYLVRSSGDLSLAYAPGAVEYNYLGTANPVPVWKTTNWSTGRV